MAHPVEAVVLAAMPTAPSLPKLMPKQERAIEELIAGTSDAEVARRLEVRRETINRLRHNDPDFIAELNRRRAELWAASRENLRALLPRRSK